MKVTIKCRLNNRYSGFVYASMYCDDELLVSATLDYCLSRAEEQGYTIENGTEVLLWLHKNCEFKGYSK